MNFLKWFGYLALCAVFIWFVFRPLHMGGATDTIATDSNTVVQDNDPRTTIEDTDDLDQTDNFDETSEDSDSENNEPSNTTDIDEGIISNNGINLNNKYLIVVGSFGKLSNANRMLAKVKSNGQDAQLTKIRNLHRVVAASTDTEADAKNLRSHFTHIYKVQCFILEQ